MNSPQTFPNEPKGSPVPALTTALVVTLALVAVATFLPSARLWRLWGINHLAFYDMPVRLAAFIVMALAFVPSVARAIFSALQQVPRALAGGGSRSTLVILVISVASIFLFHELRAATQLLGDGDMLVKDFMAAQKGHATVVTRSAHAIVTTEPIAPGMTLLYYWTVKAAGPFKLAVVDALAILPCVLGGAFVFFLLRFARDLPASPALKAWLLVLGLFTASLQLFFGYIENYSGIMLLLMLYVAAGFRVLHGRGGLWLPGVLLIVSSYTHVQSLVFAPSLIYLAVWRWGGRDERRLGRIVVSTLVVLTVAGALAGRALEIPGDFYLPLTSDDGSYGIVSPGHLLDMVNEVLILLPIALFVVVAWYLGRRRGGAGEAAGEEGEDAWFTTPREWQFVAVMLAACLVYIAFFKPEIGMARDWDLFSMAAVALVPLALLVVNRVLDGDRAGGAALVSAPALVITAVLTAGWIGINASPDRAADRYEAILSYDRTHAGYAYETLASFYHARDQIPRAIRAMENGATISGNPRLYAKLAFYYQENGDLKSAITILSDAVARHPEHNKARQKLLDLLEKGQRWEELITVAREGMALYPQESIYCFALGIGLIRSGQTDAGLDVFRSCMTLDVPQAMRDHMQRLIDEYGTSP